MNTNKKNNAFSNAVASVAELVLVSEKFSGFTIPATIEAKIMTAGLMFDTTMVWEARQSLANVLRAFFNNSPKFFEGQLNGFINRLDADLATKARNAITVYKIEVEAKPTLSEAIMFHQKLVDYFNLILKTQYNRLRQAEARRQAVKAAKLDHIRQGNFVIEVPFVSERSRSATA